MQRGGQETCYNENACRPGCMLPCCKPIRRRCPPSPRIRRNPCIFIPAPGRSTKRYCGDPCSPPPPRCTPRPRVGSMCCPPRPRKARSPRCKPICDPCNPCPPPLSYSRPYRPQSKLYSCTNPCKPKKCGPLDPCNPCTFRCDPCIPCIPDPCCYKPKYCKPDPCCPPRIYKGKSSTGSFFSKRGKSNRRSKSRGSSSCSSYCESPGSFICKSPCSDNGSACSNEGKCKSKANEPHFCPWEADVTVTGTVRGHCTSTAVEVAKRLTGKFVSRGKRYTSKKGCDKLSSAKYSFANQKMTLGCLDDGTQLDFTRNKCEDEDEDDCPDDNQVFFKGRTNNAAVDTSPSSTAWRYSGSGRGLKIREKERSGRDEVPYATAFIRGGNCDTRSRYDHEGLHTEGGARSYFRRCESARRASPRRRRAYQGQIRARSASFSSDSDKSSYKTASERTNYGRCNINFTRIPYHQHRSSESTRHVSRREQSERRKHSRHHRYRTWGRDKEGERTQHRRGQRTPSSEEGKGIDGEGNESDNFYPESEGDCTHEEENEVNDSDDIDEANHHHQDPTYEPADPESEVKKRNSSPTYRHSHRYHRQGTRDRHPRSSHPCNSSGEFYDANEVSIEPYPDAKQSTENDSDDARSTRIGHERPASQSRHSRRRNRVTYTDTR